MYVGHYTLDYINKCFGTNYSSLDNIKKDSCIIHLAGYYKPWIHFDTAFVREWDEYFKKSPYKHQKLKRKSIKLREFMISHKLTRRSYFFLIYWRDKFLNFMVKLKKKII